MHHGLNPQLLMEFHLCMDLIDKKYRPIISFLHFVFSSKFSYKPTSRARGVSAEYRDTRPDHGYNFFFKFWIW